MFDLTKGGPKVGLEAHRANTELRVIACGGDGTVGWVLSVLDEMRLEKPPAVAILPLGTGNDLGRTLGWGGGYNNESMESFIKKVIFGKEVKLDRWTLAVKPLTKTNYSSEGADGGGAETGAEAVKAQLPLKVLNNYFSIGADAKIALDFHSARGKFLKVFQIINFF